MKANSKLALFLRRLKKLTNRVLNRLQFFPFTLLYVLFNAALQLILPLRPGVVRVASATGEVTSLPRDAMLWLDRVLTGPPGCQFDVCLQLPREEAAANLHDVFSVLLTFPRLRSIGLYWDASSLADDLPLLQSKRDRSDPASAALHEEIGSLGSTQFAEFLRSDHGEFALPVAASRDAQTLLKREAGGGFVGCLNVPPDLASLADTVVRARPDIWFFDLSLPTSQMTRAANHRSIFGHGLSLHERMALASAADAYVGSFDEKGCAAVISGRPAILLGGSNGGRPELAGRGDTAVWLPGPVQPPEATNAVLQFLSRHLKQEGGASA